MIYQVETQNIIATKMLLLFRFLGWVRLEKEEFVGEHSREREIAEGVVAGYREMRIHKKKGTKPKTVEAFLAEMRGDFGEWFPYKK